MGNLSPRPGRTPSNRRKREQRAFTLTMVGGGAAVVAVVGVILAIAGVISGSIPLIAAIVAVVCFLWFRSTVGGR
jgi:fatty acid desaturase